MQIYCFEDFPDHSMCFPGEQTLWFNTVVAISVRSPDAQGGVCSSGSFSALMGWSQMVFEKVYVRHELELVSYLSLQLVKRSDLCCTVSKEIVSFPSIHIVYSSSNWRFTA